VGDFLYLAGIAWLHLQILFDKNPLSQGEYRN